MKKQTGFAIMEREKLLAHARQGGAMSHTNTNKDKRAHEWTADTARQAALKSWENRRKKAAQQAATMHPLLEIARKAVGQ